ncbi:MAG TPA: hypothetical protein VFP48_04510, partial [Steroidobacteraceae bacterium]|nr:hypothetical protein [Steroidobacteraceae bacterium]
MNASRNSALALITFVGLLSVALGRDSGAIAPEDVAYPGTLTLQVDASDVDRRIVRVVQTVPVAGPGPLTLLYPRWLPGNHSTTGPVEMLA